MSIETVQLRGFSLDRALKVAPKEFLPAYDWIAENAGKGPQKLPSQQNGLDPGLGVKLIAQRGIQKPGGFKYALTIKSSSSGQYKDGIQWLDDGTWVLKYRQQEKGATSIKGTDLYNEALKNCLVDGLPVGVFVSSDKGKSLYDCMGLAFVESFDPSVGEFLLRGPVDPAQPRNFWSEIEEDDLPEEDRELLEQIDDKDERIIALTEQVRRVRQDKFRAALMKAYDSKCTISSLGVPNVLQAAHIISYLGPKSQVPSNGLLLRADLHLLYDSYLLSVDPDGHRVCVSSQLKDSPYSEYNKQKIRATRSAEEAPSDARLATHFDEFRKRSALDQTEQVFENTRNNRHRQSSNLAHRGL